MRREPGFVLSHRPYAVDLGSLCVTEPPEGCSHSVARLDAVWFRRRKGVTIACVGELRDLQCPAPADAVTFLAAHDDGRYGGDCKGRWDGQRYWGSQVPAVIEEHLTLLRPMLAAFPACPPPFDGWWVF